jgi:hypothetical protein
MKNHLEQLQQWLNTPGAPINTIRKILGDIAISINEAAQIFYDGQENPQPDTVQKARKCVQDIAHWNAIHTLLPQVDKLVRQQGTIGVNVLHLVHVLERSNFTPEQIDDLKKVAFQPDAPRRRPKRVNEKGQQEFTNQSLYNLSKTNDRTIRVVREILQNAVDSLKDVKDEDSDFKPSVSINTYNNTGDDKLMDIIVTDNGIGMDWDTVREKFFVLYSSGKEDSTESTGGYGVAKGIIQDTPTHTWGLDTKPRSGQPPTHSNRFSQNVYFAHYEGDYQPIQSELHKSKHGTTLTLFGLPRVNSWDLKRLCEIYGTNGKVTIYLDNGLITPKFTLDAPDVKPIDDAPDVIGGNPSEKQAAEKAFDSVKKELSAFSVQDDAQTTVKFYIRKVDQFATGQLYVMINGQYQYDSYEYISKLDIIANVQTTARPRTNEYPIDPGRENLRGPVANKVKSIVSLIRQFAQKLGQDELFKDGLETIVLNKDAKPMSTKVGSKRRSDLAHALMIDLGQAIQPKSEEPHQDTNVPPQHSQSNTPKPPPLNTEEEPETPPQNPEQEEAKTQAEKIVERVKQEVGAENVNPTLVRAAVNQFIQSAQDRITFKARIDDLIAGLLTPANIMIQKNFIGRQVLENPKNMHLTSEMLLLWQKTLDILTDDMAIIKTNKAEFIPGLVFTDECLGLSVPPKEELGRPYHCIAINPITLASAVNPKHFHDKLDPHSSKTAFKAIEEPENQKDPDDTPINRLTKFIYHIGVHELCHLFYPGGADSFHENVTYMEIVCQRAIPRIRDEVKKSMKEIRSKSNRVINMIATEKGKLKESVLITFTEWMGKNWN